MDHISYMKVKYDYWQKIIDVYQISGKTVKDFIYDGVYFTEKSVEGEIKGVREKILPEKK